MVKNISSFLDKFKKLEPPKRSILDAFVRVLDRTLGIFIKESEVTVERGVIYLSTHPSIKSEVMLNKARLLRALNEELSSGKKVVSDIR